MRQEVAKQLSQWVSQECAPMKNQRNNRINENESRIYGMHAKMAGCAPSPQKDKDQSSLFAAHEVVQRRAEKQQEQINRYTYK